MNVLKKIASAVAAVAVLAGISVPVGAADSTLKLLTQSTEIFGDYTLATNTFFDDLIVKLDNSHFIDSFVSVTEDDLAKWRNTGVFKYNTVEVNGKVNWNRLTLAGDNQLMVNLDVDNSIAKYYAINYNGKDKIDIVRSSDEWMNYMNGWIISDSYSNNVLSLKCENPATGKTYTDKFSGDGTWYSGFYMTGKYIAGIAYTTKTYPDSALDGKYNKYDIVVKGMKSNGKVETLYTDSVNFLYSTSGEKFFQISTMTAPYGWVNHVFLEDSAEWVTIITDSKYYVEEVYGKNAVATLVDNYGETVGYQLIKLTEKGSELKGDLYKDMYTLEGKLYRVKTFDDKWGFINTNGKLLATFDDVSEFDGKYAPVVKNGKAYLVDKAMKCVSEKISATYVNTLGEGLYYVENGSKKYLMTYASDSATTTTPATTKPSTNGKDISRLEFYKLANEEYTGGKICPDPSIYDGNYLLEEKTDYTLSYKNNTALGTGTVIVKGCGKYSGTKTLKFNIVLKKPAFSAKKNGNSKAALSWKKVTGAAGYEIYYAAGNGSFKKLASVSSSTFSKSVSRLDIKNNSYKFRIRAFATASNGKKVYSSWSKTVKIG